MCTFGQIERRRSATCSAASYATHTGIASARAWTGGPLGLDDVVRASTRGSAGYQIGCGGQAAAGIRRWNVHTDVSATGIQHRAMDLYLAHQFCNIMDRAVGSKRGLYIDKTAENHCLQLARTHRSHHEAAHSGPSRLLRLPGHRAVRLARASACSRRAY